MSRCIQHRRGKAGQACFTFLRIAGVAIFTDLVEHFQELLGVLDRIFRLCGEFRQLNILIDSLLRFIGEDGFPGPRQMRVDAETKRCVHFQERAADSLIQKNNMRRIVHHGKVGGFPGNFCQLFQIGVYYGNQLHTGVNQLSKREQLNTEPIAIAFPAQEIASVFQSSKKAENAAFIDTGERGNLTGAQFRVCDKKIEYRKRVIQRAKDIFMICLQFDSPFEILCPLRSKGYKA